MKIRFIGDVHGKFKGYSRLIYDAPYSIQVGDMGVGFKKYNRDSDLVWDTNPPFDKMSDGKHLFIRGNHDNPGVCLRHKYWIPDGSLIDGVFCVGGATSIDKAWRTKDIDWWEDEEVSQDELEKILQVYSELKPEIVVTHECPESIANQILAAFNKVKFNDFSRTRQTLERMYYVHQPKIWIFGHWHQSLNFMDGTTNFICLNELEHLDLEV